jgi:hypothetical protein
MAAAHPFPPAELEEALRKIKDQEPLWQDERELVQRRLGATPPPTLQTWDELEQEARTLWDQGLRGEEFIRALCGGNDGEDIVLRTPEEFDAYFGPGACAPST